jgi:2,3-bisphosphoglycerate-independent phosphoglycerate mutase
MEKSYANDITDEFVKPIIIDKHCLVEKDDSIIFYNFRPDRVRQITRAFVDEGFDKFKRNKIQTTYVTLTQYDKTIKNVKVAFEPQILENTLGEYLSKLWKKQLRIAETEKYAHVTFFFNGGVEKPYNGEERILVPSPKVATYDMQPEMSAYKVKDKLLKELEKNYLDFVVINFANADMVGHTGIIKAAIKAVEAVDECLGEISEYVENHKYNMLVIADHGNAEEMLRNGQVMTAHSTNKVPGILISNKKYSIKEGKLADIAPTMLEIMDIDKPTEMTGRSLIK